MTKDPLALKHQPSSDVFFQNEIDPRLTWFVSSVLAVLGAVKIPNKITLEGGCPSTWKKYARQSGSNFPPQYVQGINDTKFLENTA